MCMAKAIIKDLFLLNRNIFGCFRIKADSSSYTFSQPPVANSGQFYLQRKLVEVGKLAPFFFLLLQIFLGVYLYLRPHFLFDVVHFQRHSLEQPVKVWSAVFIRLTGIWHWNWSLSHTLKRFYISSTIFFPFLQVAFNWLHRHSALHMLQASFLSFRIISSVQLLNL